MTAVVRVVFIGIVLSLTAQVRAESLGDKIGHVAAYLLSTSATSSSGSENAARSAAAWDKSLIAEDKQPSNTIARSFQRHDAGSNAYDVIRSSWFGGGHTVETTQTIGVWVITLRNENTDGKSGADLVPLVNGTAREYLAGFTNRAFSFAGTYDGVMVFAPTLTDDGQSDDWRDNVWAVSYGATVGFTCCKKQSQSMAFAGEDKTEANIVWFDIADARMKKRSR